MAGTPYNGLPGNVVLPAAVNIVSSTDTSPIVMLATGHGCRTGDTVDVSGHQTNINANGVWVVTFVDVNHVSLNGSVGNGVGGATGTLQPLAFTGNVSLNPVNGDPYDASTYIPGMSCLADRTAFNLWTTGAVKIASVGFYSYSGSGSVFGGAGINPGAIAGNWGFPSGGTYAAPSGIAVVAGDLVEFEIMGSYNLDLYTSANNGQDLGIAPAMSLYNPGEAPTFNNASVLTSQRLTILDTGSTFPASPLNSGWVPFALQGIALASGQSLAALNLAAMGTVAPINLPIGKGLTFRWRVYRGTGVPQ